MYLKFWLLTIAFLAGALMTTAAFGQIAHDELPEVAQGIGIEQKIDAQLPLDAQFNDEDNNFVKLGKYFLGKKPVLISFNYSNCPKLCSIQLQNLASSLQDIRLKPGKDFELVIISIDPNEQAQQARELKAKYLALYGDLETTDGWHVLTGKRENIQRVTDACGYKYKYIPEQKIYSHESAFIFCSPKGKVIRYLDGLDSELRFRLDKALMEAGEGKVGTWLDKIVYFSGCYVYDEHQGKYTMQMMSIMRLGGGITVLALALWLVPTWLLSWFSPKKTKPDATPADVASESS